MKLLEPIYLWQRWPRGYEPNDEQLIAMGDEEYEHWFEQHLREHEYAEMRYAGHRVYKTYGFDLGIITTRMETNEH